MSAKAIGPTFPAELEAAGLLGLPFSWTPEGTFWFDDAMPQEQQDAVIVVYDAHDPTEQLPPTPPADVVVLFNHENRLRSQEGTPPLTLEDFRQQFKV